MIALRSITKLESFIRKRITFAFLILPLHSKLAILEADKKTKKKKEKGCKKIMIELFQIPSILIKKNLTFVLKGQTGYLR